MTPLVDDPLAWADAQPADPVRRRVLQALARRAQAQPPGVLRDKLIAALRQRAAAGPHPPHAPRAPRPPAHAHALAGLLALLQADAGPELRQVRMHEGTWRRLRAARSVAELNAPVIGNPGPLNGQALAARTLQQIHALSPDYLQRLMAQMDVLSTLESPPAPGAGEKPARTPKKKTSEKR